jgi:hypothetical protein
MHCATGKSSLLQLGAAFLFLILGSLPQVVLCVAGDHRAIEVVPGLSCEPGSRFFGALLEVPPCQDDGCPRGCTDTALNSGPALRAPTDSDPASPVFSAISPVFIRLPVPRFDHGLLAGLFTIPPVLTPRVLRTAVLLC